MKLEFKDDQFPRYVGEWHKRRVARAIVVQDGKVFVHMLRRSDIFGTDVSYPETPGGGVDDVETYEEAIVRECKEELGKVVEIDAYIGEVDDEYALIGRHNLNRFYLCHVIGDCPKHFEGGDDMIEKTLLVDIDEAIRLYEENPKSPIFNLVQRREMPILLAARKLIKGV